MYTLKLEPCNRIQQLLERSFFSENSRTLTLFRPTVTRILQSESYSFVFNLILLVLSSVLLRTCFSWVFFFFLLQLILILYVMVFFQAFSLCFWISLSTTSFRAKIVSYSLLTSCYGQSSSLCLH